MSIYTKFKQFLKKKNKYLITYNVTNLFGIHIGSVEYKEDAMKKKKSKNYKYIIESESEKEAKEKFIDLWNDAASRYEPKPELNIVSISVYDYSNPPKYYKQLNFH